MNLGIPRILDPVSREALLTALRGGDTMKAVRYYRLATGAGPTEARRAVENIRIQNNIPSTRPAIGAGFPVARLVLIAIAVLLGFAAYVKYAH